MNDIKLLCWGIIAKVIGLFVPVKKNCWVFGSDLGQTYREGSKYLLEYMLNNHPEYDCIFLTRSSKVRNELKQRGIPCRMNLSFSGVYAVARAECVFTTQQSTDVLFALKKKNRRYFYLVHGQPYKIALNELNKTDYYKKKEFEDSRRRSMIIVMIRRWLSRTFICNFGFSDSEFVSATSDFLSFWQKRDFGEFVTSKVLGMPRNDALFQPERMREERWIEGCNGKLIVSYMPTHRLYGRGTLSPTPFANRADIKQWMQENDVVLVVKNHPTMLLYADDINPYENSNIRDITTAGIDPMTVLYHSDALITDYSSVWMDYLLLARPILFYIYDDFEHDDVGVYYDIKKEGIGHFCYTEDALFEMIKKLKTNYDSMRPAANVISKFHKYTDGCSCERYFQEITRPSINR